MTMIGGHERVAYTIEHRGDCILITGDVPAEAFRVIACLADEKSILCTATAKALGVSFAIGLPTDLNRLRSASAKQKSLNDNIVHLEPHHED